ncbi:hypothetical protein Cni_G26239 [Canna indica]|uniref:Uncharacterized protein n=1 Tax=Canna indica TaxID=4628 RepID=A0AAQ3L5Q4_9LILI|nr:hypothetical protein Cni_G26239 [Canna indica]
MDFWQLKEELLMDNISSKKDISLELVRESLISISQCRPDLIVASHGLPVAKSAAAAGENDSSGAEKYRSELISISYMQPTDVKPKDDNNTCLSGYPRIFTRL